jgi:hypothetical protein
MKAPSALTGLVFNLLSRRNKPRSTPKTSSVSDQHERLPCIDGVSLCEPNKRSAQECMGCGG